MPPKRKAPNDSNNNAYENTERNKALRVVRDGALRAGDPELALLVAHLSRGTRNRAVSRTAASLVREKRAFQRSLLTAAVPANASGRSARVATVEASIRKAWKDPALFRSLDGAALGRALVSYAALAGAEGIVKLLLAHPKIDVNARTPYGSTALALAASLGYDDVVRALLAHPKIDVNARDQHGWTALILACRYGREGVVRALLAHPKVDVNVRDDYHGITALVWARTDRIRAMLVRAGARA